MKNPIRTMKNKQKTAACLHDKNKSEIFHQPLAQYKYVKTN